MWPHDTHLPFLAGTDHVTPTLLIQDMSFYARPGSYPQDLDKFYAATRKSNPSGWARQAGVGIGVYYDGRNGYPREWNATTAKSFLAEVVHQGGEAIDIFRLNKDGVNDWPKEDWWWPLIQDFADGA